MKKLGIIGGAGPLASALLYETIVRESYLQGIPQPEIHLINFPFTRGLCPHESDRSHSIIERELSQCVDALALQGVDIGLLACNTLHLFLKQLSQVPIPFLSLPDAVLQEACECGHKRLLVLATSNTSHAGLYSHPNITVFYPNEKRQCIVNSVIDRILEGNVLSQDALKLSHLIQETALEVDFEGVVLGCTDLPVLHHFHPIKTEKKVYDSIKIPAKNIRGYL